MHAHATVSIWQRDEHSGQYSAELNGYTLKLDWQPEAPDKRRGFRWLAEKDGKEAAKSVEIFEEPEVAMASAEAYARATGEAPAEA